MKDPYTPAEQAGYAWVQLDLQGKNRLEASFLPGHCVLAGSENGAPTYMARTYHEGHWEVAKLNSWARFGFGYSGKEIEKAFGEVLVASHAQEPAWINGAFGERVKEAVGIDLGCDIEMLGRAWHKGRWIPGKVVSRQGQIYFPFGGREHTSRHYQLLCANLSWQRVDSDLTGILIPVDDQLCGTPENSLQHICKAWQYDRPAHLAFSGANYRLIQSAPRECYWASSRDGEQVRDAVAMHDFQIGRLPSPDGTQYSYGFVHPADRQYAGLHLRSGCAKSYQVLIFDTNRQQAPVLPYKLLSEQQPSETSDLSQDVFLVTKLSPGESAGQAYEDMITEAQACQALSDMLNSQSDVITEGGSAEVNVADHHDGDCNESISS